MAAPPLRRPSVWDSPDRALLAFARAAQPPGGALRRLPAAVVAAGVAPYLPRVLRRRPAPLAAGAEHWLAIPAPGDRVDAHGEDIYGEGSVPGLGGRRAVAVSCGRRHSLVLLGDGTVLAIGCGSSGQDQLHLSRGAAAVAAGEAFSAVLLDTGAVRVCGCGAGGEPIAPPAAAELRGRAATAIAAGAVHLVVLLDDGDVVGCGATGWGQLSFPDRGGRRVTAVAAGQYHTLLILDDGSVAACGRNDYGQADVPDLRGRRAVAASAGLYHSLLLLDDGSARAFGSGKAGQLALFRSRVAGVAAVAAGEFTSHLLFRDGTLRSTEEGPGLPPDCERMSHDAGRGRGGAGDRRL